MSPRSVPIIPLRHSLLNSATALSSDRTLAQAYTLAFMLSLGVTVSNSFARMAYALVLPAMRGDLEWNYTQAGWLNTANAIGYLLGAVATRVVIRQTGNRTLFIGGVLLTALAVLATGLTRDIVWLGFWRLASGVFGAAAFISGGALSGNILPARPQAAATTIAIYFAGGGVGFLLCGVALPLLLDAGGPSAWQDAWIWMGWAGLVLLLACAWAAARIAEPNLTPNGETPPAGTQTGVEHLKAGVAAYVMFGLGYIGYMTFVIAWMRDHGASTNSVIAMWVTFGVASLLGPWLWRIPLERWIPGHMLAAALTVLGIGSVLPLIDTGTVPMLLSAALFGASMWNIPGSITNLVKRALPKQAWGATVATFTIYFAAGQIAGPVMTGALADLFGGLFAGLVVSGGVLFLGALIALTQRDVQTTAAHRQRMTRTMPRIVIIGGGFSGSAAAVQLVRRSPQPLAITIVEPRASVGGGLAYSSDEPDHRINGQPQMHSLDPAEPGMFAHWCDQHNALAGDAGARVANGTLFVRRSTFRRYLEHTVVQHSAWPNGSTIAHQRDTAIDARPGLIPDDAAWQVVTANGAQLPCDLLILACGHTRARLPAAFAAGFSRHPRVIADPLSSPRLPPVPADDRVLVLGSSLTAYDAVSTLLSAGHRGCIDIVSRRGLRPRPQRPPPAPGAAPLAPMLERTGLPPEAFIRNAMHPPPLTVRKLLRTVRSEIRTQARTGVAWDHAFDHLRDMLGQLWPLLSLTEKRRFFRQVRPWYDVHRFRVPPQNSAIVHAGEQRGQVRFRAAAIHAVAFASANPSLRVTLRERGAGAAHAAEYDHIINCTGVDATPVHEVALYAALMQRALVIADASGTGLAVDAQCRALADDGTPARRLRIIGPPTAGAQGDPLGSAFIAIQVHRIVPDILKELGAAW